MFRLCAAEIFYGAQPKAQVATAVPAAAQGCRYSSHRSMFTSDM